MQLSNGTVLHGECYDYVIDRQLGQGSFGITYQAHVCLKGRLGQLGSSVTVAIKEFFMREVNWRDGSRVNVSDGNTLYEHYRNSFMREANNLSLLDDSHIVRVLETFEANNTVYLVMEFLPGGNLDDYIRSHRRLDEREALGCIIQIAGAVGRMHSASMLHLDIKPLNVMRRDDGTLVLIDFGLSKLFTADGMPETSTTVGAGTMGYAPLEQQSYRKSDGFMPTLDIYALGATMLKMLTGQTPPSASVMLNDGFPADSLSRLGVSSAVSAFVERAMDPMRRRRFQAVDEFLAEARRLLDETPQDTAQATRGDEGDSCGSSSGGDMQSEPTLPLEEPTDPIPDSRHPSPKIQWRVPDAKANSHFARYLYGNGVNYRRMKDEDYRQYVRRLLGMMWRYGSISYQANYEYADDQKKTLNVYTLGEAWEHLYDYPVYKGIMDGGIHVTHKIQLTIDIIVGLEISTGLQFRLASPCHIEQESTNGWFGDRDERVVCFDLWHGLVSRRKYTDEVWPLDVRFPGNDSFVFSLELVGDSPIVRGGMFDLPYTQPSHEAIEVVGLGFYKVLDGGKWNITTPAHPFENLLPHGFDDISRIGVKGIPGPMFGETYFGIEARLGDRIYYYEYVNGKFSDLTLFEPGGFRLKMTLTVAEAKSRETWT